MLIKLTETNMAVVLIAVSQKLSLISTSRDFVVWEIVQPSNVEFTSDEV